MKSLTIRVSLNAYTWIKKQSEEKKISVPKIVDALVQIADPDFGNETVEQTEREVKAKIISLELECKKNSEEVKELIKQLEVIRDIKQKEIKESERRNNEYEKMMKTKLF
jgi:hypothetical protein